MWIAQLLSTCWDYHRLLSAKQLRPVYTWAGLNVLRFRVIGLHLFYSQQRHTRSVEYSRHGDFIPTLRWIRLPLVIGVALTGAPPNLKVEESVRLTGANDCACCERVLNHTVCTLVFMECLWHNYNLFHLTVFRFVCSLVQSLIMNYNKIWRVIKKHHLLQVRLLIREYVAPLSDSCHDMKGALHSWWYVSRNYGLAISCDDLKVWKMPIKHQLISLFHVEFLETACNKFCVLRCKKSAMTIDSLMVDV